jgi:acyl-CoA thioester hydrolase
MLAPTAGRFEGAEHRLPVRVYYEDTDFTGVVYHANYARYFERGRSDFLRLAGLDHTALLALPTPLAFTITRLALDYLRPARIDDALEVRTAFETARGARFAIRQRLWRGDEMLCAGEVQAACVDLTGRPRRLPADLAARLKPYVADTA